MAKKAKKVRIKLVRSTIGKKPDQRKTVAALGLRKLNAVVEKELTPSIEGMIRKVAHLVQIEEIEG
ncbi:ribosomal protein L30 [Spirochaeta thermophila DSM 6578]|uniref:Large ribosomal subunit protein uL30 n=1 Tax=Winmispira thermophila (strain ATCC 700085 / DSM 6578 / Z-1203) TaxID=869211 RepID=G0G9R6_WINT7|nr:50S ribosomal protein L30 [Spirochaeta thermophila]AEJ60816.1 ribosomal protein L30 [Spirochaeta thermophila DSM 6578]